MPMALFFNNINKLIESSNAHDIYKMIAKKILYIERIDQLCTTGVTIEYLDLRCKDKRVSDSYLVNELIETVEISLYGLLRMAGFSVLIDLIPELNNPNSFVVEVAMKSIGFSGTTSIHLVPVTIMIFMLKWLSKSELV